MLDLYETRSQSQHFIEEQQGEKSRHRQASMKPTLKSIKLCGINEHHWALHSLWKNDVVS